MPDFLHLFSAAILQNFLGIFLHFYFGVDSKWLLSYNDCAFIRELYQDYSLFSFERVHSMAQRYSAGSIFPELLIGNYDLFERERTQPYQLTLFGEDELDGEKVWKERM